MLTMDDVQQLERVHYETVCAASETGGLSVVETADIAVRLNSRLLTEIKRMLRPQHRERYVPHPAAIQQSLPFAASAPLS